MEYSKTDFLKDFARRTKANLDKIDKCVSNGEQLFEVTQLVNSFIGLLIIPQQTGDGFIEDNHIDAQTLSLLQAAVSKNTYINNRKDKTLRNIVYHIRNAVAHDQMVFEPKQNQNKTMDIYSITFKDKFRNQEFEIKLDISTIRQFLNEFFDNFLGVKGGE